MNLLSRLLLALFIFVALELPVWASQEEHRIALLNGHIEATQARIDLILAAQKTIKAQYFIFGKDNTSLAGLALVAQRVRQDGVKAQLIVDAFFNHVPKPVLSYLASIGVEIKVYHPFRLNKPKWWTQRMHDKGISIDSTKMIRGGRNVEGSYFGFASKNSYFGFFVKRNYIDRDIYVEGPEVKSSDLYFDELFDSQDVALAKVSKNRRKIEKGRRMLEEALILARGLNLFKFDGAGDNLSKLEMLTVNNLEFLHDPVGLKGQAPGIAEEIRKLLLSAKRKILIESPYLVPSDEFMWHIQKLKKINPNIEITILTNSAISTDGLLPQGGYIRYRKRLLALGLRIFEYQGPESLHAKSIVIDDELAGVSSYNLDPRSQFLNTEIAVVSRDTKLAQQLTESINLRMQNAWEMGLDGRPLNGDSQLRNMSLGRRIALGASICASILIKNQL